MYLVGLNMNDKSANIINKHFFVSFQDVIDRLKNEKNLKGVILTSAKKTFIAGSDIEMLYNVSIPKCDYDLVFYLICFGSIPDKLFYLELLYQFHGISTDDFLTNYFSSSLSKSKPFFNLDHFNNDIGTTTTPLNLFSDNSSYADEFTVNDLDEFGLPSNYFAV